MKQIFVSAILFCFLILDLSASQYYWKNGSRQGSEYYWKNGTGPSSQYYWKNGTGPSSQYYWKNGSRQGSEYYWVNSSGESFPNTNTIGICMSLMDNMNNVPELCKGYR